MTGTHAPLAERFWRHVIKNGANECWMWNGACDSHGYGIIGSGGAGPIKLSHRLSFELHNGEIPHGACILHQCDNRQCVNPMHLFIGTNLDNVRDKLSKGRHPRGEASPRAKLTEANVRQILLSGEPPTALAKRFNTDPSNIVNIRKRRSWKHVIIGL